jgi:hypothetical protein
MLRDRQRAFAAAVFDRSPDLAAQLRPGRFPPAQLLQVYRNNVIESLTGALRAIYPVVERLVGDGFFRYAAHEYLRAHRPTAGNLHAYGDRWAGFLAGFAPAAGLPYLPDVARLEWAWHEAFHAADAPAFDPGVLGRVPDAQRPKLRFTLHPSARLVASDYPIVRIHEANRGDDPGTASVDLAEGGVEALVVRRGLVVCIEPLAPGEAGFLRALRDGRPLEHALDTALAAQTGFDLQATLGSHVQRGTIVGCHTGFESEELP